MTRKAKLKWHCRRGMRELDLLLDGFLEKGYDALSPLDRDCFERLLDCRNEDLMDWLVEGDLPQDEPLAGIVSRIRDAEVRDQ
jgi:antitoxin CptB